MNNTENHHIVHPGDFEDKRGFGWGYFIVGALFLVGAAMTFANPAGSLEALAFMFGFLAIFNGVWSIINRSGSTLRLIAGILDIIIGVFILSNILYAMAALPFIFAIWFIIDSVLRLSTAGFARIFGAGYFRLSVILNIIGIAIGIMLLINPITAALTLSFLVGFYLLLVGVEFIAFAFAK